MRARLGILVLALGTFTAGAAQDMPKRPKIGVALGGGGARGIAHIGVLRALQELHIPIDYLAGTSMGAVIGGLYACGSTTDGLEGLTRSIKWATIFQDAPERPDRNFRRKEDDFDHLLPFEAGLKKDGLALPPGLISGSKLAFVLQRAAIPCSAALKFDDLRIPFRAVAMDVETGEPVILSEGSLAHAMRASMAIPALFSAVQLDGRLLVDGGGAQNLPVQTARAMGADVVIAVEVGESGMAPKTRPDNVGAMIRRFMDLPLQQNTGVSRRLADLVIQPDLTGYTSADFGRGRDMISRGYQATMAQAGVLRRWAEPAAEYEAWTRQRDAPAPPAPVIDEIEIAPVRGLDDRRIRRLVRTIPGRLDVQTLGRDLKRIYALGFFEIVTYSIEARDGRQILRIMARPKPWGPTYLRAGLELATDLQGLSSSSVVMLIDATELNGLGAEWKTTVRVGSPLELRTRFYQPVTPSGAIFVSPRFAGTQVLRDVFDQGIGVGTYRLTGALGGLDLGADFGTWGEMRVGYERGYGKGRRRIGSPTLPDVDFDLGAIAADLTVDRLDDANLPRSGMFANVHFAATRKSLGATVSYDRLEARTVGVHTRGRWTGMMQLSAGDGLGTTIPFYDDFLLGGPLRLSGRPLGQISGNTYGLGSILLYRRMTRTQSVIVKNLYLGVSAEAGNAWLTHADVTLTDMKTAGSVFAITDTLLGPLVFAYGRSGGNASFYVFLNRPF